MSIFPYPAIELLSFSHVSSIMNRSAIVALHTCELEPVLKIHDDRSLSGVSSSLVIIVSANGSGDFFASELATKKVENDCGVCDAIATFWTCSDVVVGDLGADSLRTVTESADTSSSSASFVIRIPRNVAPSSKNLDFDDDICSEGKESPCKGVSCCKGEDAAANGACSGKEWGAVAILVSSSC